MRSLAIRLFVAAVAIVLIPVVANAGHRGHRPHDFEYNRRGWAEVYTPFYHRHYRSDGYLDPNAYYPARRGYYPYYNSGYWRPTDELRYRRACCRPDPVLPRYYQAWGYPRPIHKYRKWRRW